MLVEGVVAAAATFGLGWSALRSGRRPLALMVALQAQATVSALGSWALAHASWVEDELDGRKSPTKSPTGERPSSPSLGGRAVSPSRRRRGTSQTLPRGWRYHSKTGLFEHKRTGRVQYERPGSVVQGAVGSPLHANLDILPEVVAEEEGAPSALSPRHSVEEMGGAPALAPAGDEPRGMVRSHSHTWDSPRADRGPSMDIFELRRAFGAGAPGAASADDVDLEAAPAFGGPGRLEDPNVRAGRASSPEC